MITNFWKDIRFYCMNHDKPVLMTVMSGESAFYACPKYMLKDEEHPDGHEKGEPMCMNRISFTRAQSVVDKLMEKVEKDRAAGVFAADYTGYRYNVSGIEVEVLKYSLESGMKIGILNRKAINP